ncbi:hypothetical protein AB840_03755 [Megasphaera cerevisiae DSM 20462]|uniref:Uncharacterized protein n=1 Tax=Megasphaera cerevisiae DSM 20462 TaxID=1122219 RepID=A0A0J6WX14_9FIRM|nr:hypothetical protein AB840_03755 [Megasphaera cerevisiae DSM 20462]
MGAISSHGLLEDKRAVSAVVLFGGSLNNGSNAGPFYANLNNDVGNANWNYGALGMLYIADTAHAPWQK